jgi:hypothetical protein
MRLFPRYSLRFAWLALTIFLIVFALGASSWKRNQAHTAIVERLLASKYAVEEDEVSWAGYFPAQRVIGLIPPWVDDEGIQPFLELPRPEELRGLAIQRAELSPETQEKFFAQLERCTALEQLHLRGMRLNETQANRLKALTKLRILNLDNSWLSPGSLQFLSEMHELEILCLGGKDFAIEDIEKLAAPKLRVLQLGHCRGTELRLTKDGFGRFPLLEIMTLNRSEFEFVLCEAGAMPRLEYLAIPDVAKPSVVAWHVLPDAAPQLRGLAFHPSQFGFASRDELQRIPQLKRLMLYAKQDQNTKGLDWFAFKDSAIMFRRGFKREVEEFIQARPDIVFDVDIPMFLENIRPTELILSQQGLANTKLRWASNHWLKSSLVLAPPPAPTFIAAQPIVVAVVSPNPNIYYGPPPPSGITSSPDSMDSSSDPNPFPGPGPLVRDPFAPNTEPKISLDPFEPAPESSARDPFLPAPPVAPGPSAPLPAWLEKFGPARE